MAKLYRPGCPRPGVPVPPDMRDWLPPGHPVWLVITVVEDHMTPPCPTPRGAPAGAGPAGYDPDARLRPVHGGKPKAAAAAQDTPAADGTVISGTQAISATARPAGTVPHSFRFSGATLRKLSFAVARVRPLRTPWRRESSRRSQGSMRLPRPFH